MRRSFLLLGNPHAGIASSTLVDASVALLRARGAVVETIAPGSVSQARDAAQAAATSGRYDTVIAAGGDGTIRQIAAGMIATATPLAIVPGGTGNVLAHEIGLQRTPEAVAAMLIEGRTVRACVSRANGEPFLLMAAAGLDARVLQGLDPDLKSRVGKIAYAGPILGALSRPMERLHVAIDGTMHEANWAIIANAQHYAGAFVLTRDTDVTRRGLVAVLLRARSRAHLAALILSLARGRLDARARIADDVVLRACMRVSITAAAPVATQLDGDVFGLTPLEVETSTDEVQLVVPATCTLR